MAKGSEITPEERHKRLVAAALKQEDSKAFKFAAGTLKPDAELQAAIDKVTAETARLARGYEEDFLNEEITKEEFEHYMKHNTYAYHFHDPGDDGPYVEIKAKDHESEPVLTPYSRKPKDALIPPPPPTAEG